MGTRLFGRDARRAAAGGAIALAALLAVSPAPAIAGEAGETALYVGPAQGDADGGETTVAPSGTRQDAGAGGTAGTTAGGSGGAQARSASAGAQPGTGDATGVAHLALAAAGASALVLGAATRGRVRVHAPRHAAPRRRLGW